MTHGEPLNTSSLPTATSGSSRKAGDELKPSQTALSREGGKNGAELLSQATFQTRRELRYLGRKPLQLNVHAFHFRRLGCLKAATTIMADPSRALRIVIVSTGL